MTRFATHPQESGRRPLGADNRSGGPGPGRPLGMPGPKFPKSLGDLWARRRSAPSRRRIVAVRPRQPDRLTGPLVVYDAPLGWRPLTALAAKYPAASCEEKVNFFDSRTYVVGIEVAGDHLQVHRRDHIGGCISPLQRASQGPRELEITRNAATLRPSKRPGSVVFQDDHC